MEAAELRERAIALATPPADPKAPSPEPIGLIDRRNWERFTLYDTMHKVWPDIPFFAQPVERWPRKDQHDWVQWVLAVRVGREYVQEVKDLWASAVAAQDREHSRLVGAAKETGKWRMS